jgi:hypothetical protein
MPFAGGWMVDTNIFFLIAVKISSDRQVADRSPLEVLFIP